MYRAVGQLQGRYIPSQKKIAKGVLLTDDGTFIPARLVAKAEWMARTSPSKIQGELIWTVYPHTEYPDWFERMQRFLPDDDEIVAPAKTQTPPAFWVEIRSVRETKREQAIEQLKQSNNYFSIRGEICQQDDRQGKLIVRIRRNKIPPGKESDREYQPIDLTIDGFLPGKVEGQFWDLEVSREAHLLSVENGCFVAELPPQLPTENQLKPERAEPKEKETQIVKPERKEKQMQNIKNERKEKETQTTKMATQTQPKKTGKIIRLVK